MPKAHELKRGNTVDIDGTPHVVEDFQVSTPSARGANSIYRIRYRNLATRQKVDKNYKGDDFIPDASFEKRPVQFSYTHGDTYVFTDLNDYSEIIVSEADIAAEKPYLVDDMEDIVALVADDRVLAIELPPTVELPIVECDPSIRGASATARTKPATLSTGLIVQVPEYLSPDQIIRVDTRTGKFLSRA